MSLRSRIDWRFAVAATLVLTCLVTLMRSGQPGAPAFGILHNRELVAWLVWLLLVPGIVAAVRRVRFSSRSPLQWLLQQLIIGALFSAVSIAVSLGIESLMSAAGHQHAAPQAALISRIASGLLIYSLIAVSSEAILSHRAAREREAVAERLRGDLAEARLATLEGQLHPHFLFNALNSIAALMRLDARQAETMLEQLSELLRATLRSNPMQEVSLENALRIAEQYLAIEQIRFQERLRTSVAASDVARTALVPQLILQPLVENAVRHGIAPLEAGGTVTIRADVRGAQLYIVIEDSGVGVQSHDRSRAGSGLGVKTVRATLEQLYGTNYSFGMTPRVGGGTAVTIQMPFRASA